jgi:hypothetical protein
MEGVEEEEEIVAPPPPEEEIDMGQPLGFVEREPTAHVGMSVGMVVDFFVSDSADHVPFVMYENDTTNVSGYVPGRCSPLFAMILSMMGTHTHDFKRLFKMTGILEANRIKHVPAQESIFDEEFAISMIEDCCANKDFERAPFVCMFQNPRTAKIKAWWSGRNANSYDATCHMYYAFANTLDLERAIVLTKAEEDAINSETFNFVNALTSATCQLRKIVPE